MQTKSLRLPVFPNWFPFNDMLLDGHLKVGKYEGVKTRSWDWNYRGPLLLYTSGRAFHQAVEAYQYANGAKKHKVIIGIGELVDVRELTEKEAYKMVCNFNNVKPSELSPLIPDTVPPFEAYVLGYIAPYRIGFFFQNLRRFEQPVPFKWPAGPVKPIFTEIKPGTELHQAIATT